MDSLKIGKNYLCLTIKIPMPISGGKALYSLFTADLDILTF